MPADRVALITGISGQDGSYLAEYLLDKGFEVHGLVRRIALEDADHKLWRIRHILDRIHLHTASLESFASLYKVINKVKPDHCYHLAASSFVSYSFEDEFQTFHTNLHGTHYLLSAIQECAPQCRFYFAGTSEMFGHARETPQNEDTAFVPRSVYGISKVAGFDLVRNYRERYQLHASSGILYNHESPRRGFEFVTQKVVRGAARIAAGKATELRLGNLDARRDWGHARDYVRAMALMLEQETPHDVVIATGITHTVREFVDKAFQFVGLDYQKYVIMDPQFYRESDKVVLCGNPARAKAMLGWEPEVDFDSLVREMMEASVRDVR